MKQNKIHTLKNGLKIVIYQDTTKHSAYAELIVNYGAINNKFRLNDKEYHINDGMSHFIEHLLIEHSIYGDSSEYFKNNYVRSNGGTSVKYTSFYIKTVANFLENLEKLIKMVNIPNFTKEDIEITKPPIYEEIRRSKDNNFKSLNEVERKCLFKTIDYTSILGEIEEIKAIDYDSVKMCYDIFYQPNNQILAIAGNINPEEVIELVEKIYNEIDKEKIDYTIPNYKEPNEVVKIYDEIYKDVKENFITIDYKMNISNLSPFERVKMTFYLSYFLSYNFDEASNTYKKLIDDKISVNNIGYSSYFINDSLVISISTYTDKFDEFIELVNNTIKNKNTDIEDFEIRKKRTLISLILREENFMKMIDLFTDNILTFNYYEMDKIEDVENQNYEDFKNMINNLNFNNYCIAKMLKINQEN